MSSQKCLSCCEQFADTELLSAGGTRAQLGGSGDSRRGAGRRGDVACAHRFCRPCLLSYVSGALRHGTFPVPCPMGPATCGNVFDRSTLVALIGKDSGELLQVGASRLVLQGFRTAAPVSPMDLICRTGSLPRSTTAVTTTCRTCPYTQELHRLEVEASLDPRLRIYCPHKDCSSPLLLPDDGDTAFLKDQLATCPACGRAFCPTCIIPGGHPVRSNQRPCPPPLSCA